MNEHRDSLKFRVWDGAGNLYLPWQTAGSININGDHSIGFSADHVNTNGNFVIQKCSGLKDSNGQLIYEGDIFKGGDYYTWSPVEFKDGRFIANIPRARVFELFELFDMDSITPTVIGNSFENPELLEN